MMVHAARLALVAPQWAPLASSHLLFHSSDVALRPPGGHGCRRRAHWRVAEARKSALSLCCGAALPLLASASRTRR